MKTAPNWETDLEIDRDALDQEWLDQPTKYARICRLAAESKREAFRAEENVKIVRSELILEARTRGEAKNAGQEEAYYRTHPRHKAAKEEWINAQFEADVLNSAQFAFSQRKDALENLVRLHGQDYFSSPSLGRAVKEGSEQAASAREVLGDIGRVSAARRVRGALNKGG